MNTLEILLSQKRGILEKNCHAAPQRVARLINEGARWKQILTASRDEGWTLGIRIATDAIRLNREIYNTYWRGNENSI